MSIGTRVKERIEAVGLSQAELARRVGLDQSTINTLVCGKSRTTRNLIQIARELETTPEYLLGETDDPSLGSPPVARPVPKAEEVDEDEVLIDMIDLSYGMGGGTFLDSDRIEVDRVKFSRSWLRQFTNSPPHSLASTRGIGDSMMPTIHDRDVVIIDKSQTRVDVTLGDKIWAIVFGGIGMIKRLRPMPDGTVKISSDNQLIRDELATDGDLFIVGRVVAKVSTL